VSLPRFLLADAGQVRSAGQPAKAEKGGVMKPIKALLFVVVCSILLTNGVAMADPTEIKLTSYDDFLQADIQPVVEWNEGLEGLHPGMEDSFREPQLFVLEHLETEEGFYDPDAGLLMAWGDPADEGEIISAWELVLPEDPDLTGMCITLTAWPRSGMTSISFSLQDASGVIKGWRWPVGPGGLPFNVPATLVVAAAGGPGQAGATGYWDGGIDLTQIVSFQFDESGIAQGGIPLPNFLPGFVGQWNYWHDIIVFACPTPRPDHYDCYMVDEKTTLPPTVVSLADQFTEEDEVLVHKAREICVPTDKNGEGIVNPRLHLVCYDVFSRERVNRKVLVTNQFGEQVLRVKWKIHRLCVPSQKMMID
jgi:hypothetical protein